MLVPGLTQVTEITAGQKDQKRTAWNSYSQFTPSLVQGTVAPVAPVVRAFR
jgi:hypothetical protein